MSTLKHILVVADKTVGGDRLIAAVRPTPRASRSR